MSRETSISWCDSTVNPTTGCDGCELWHRIDKGPCYAGRLHEGRLSKSMPALYAASFTEVGLAPGRMAAAARWADLTGTARPDKPWLDGLPRLIFVGDMGDVLSRDVPFAYLFEEIVEVARSSLGSRHLWLWLTKQPRRMRQFATWLGAHGLGDWPRNLIPGTSITHKSSALRWHYLADVSAAWRFVSFEPLWDAVSLEDLRCEGLGCALPDWVIVGGESAGSRESSSGCSPFDLAWARSLSRECAERGLAFFMKQVGSRPFDSRSGMDGSGGDYWYLTADRKGETMAEWPLELRVREMPAAARTWAAGGTR